MDDIGAPRLKRAWVAWPGQGLVPPGLIWHLGPILLTSSSLGASHGKILTSEKFQVNLSTGRFLKQKQYTKQGFPVL
jgi:hypothetical protein